MRTTAYRGVLSYEQVRHMTMEECAKARADRWLFPMSGADRLTDKVRELDTEIAGLTTNKGDLYKRQEETVKTYSDSDEFGEHGGPLFKAAKDATREHGEVAEKIEDLKTAKSELLLLRPNGSGNGNGHGNPADITSTGKAETNGYRDDDESNWNAKAVLEREVNGLSMADTLKSFAGSSARVGKIELGEVIGRDALKADLVGTTGMRRGTFRGNVPVIQRPLRVLDLLNIGTMTGNTIPYVQEGGTYAAAETAEGTAPSTAKPEAGITLTDAEATARTIAHWKKIQKQSLEDSDYLRTVVENHLRYGVQRRLEAQIIAGNGTPPNLQGITGTSGIGASVTWVAQPLADQLLDSMVDVLAADGTPDASVVNPADWAKILSAKASGSGEYLAGGPFSTVAANVWGVPLVPSNAQAVGSSLVGDFSQGATLFIRSGVTVLMSDSDQDDFIKNRLTLLGEMRAALTVDYPGLFSVADLA